MALTPVAVLMFRFNNPDAMLTLLMVGAAAATLRGIESTRLAAGVRATPSAGSPSAAPWSASRFLTKMLQAFLVAAGARAGLPAVRTDLVGQAARPPARRLRLDAAGRRLVDRDRRAVAGLEPSLDRRLAEQLHPRAHPRLQRPRPAQRQRDRLRRRWRRHGRRRLGEHRHPAPVQQRDRRPDRLAAPGRAGARCRLPVVRPASADRAAPRSRSAAPGCSSPG